MPDKHGAEFVLPREALESYMKQAGMPEDATVLGAYWNFAADGLNVAVLHDSLPLVPEAAMPKQVFPMKAYNLGRLRRWRIDFDNT